MKRSLKTLLIAIATMPVVVVIAFGMRELSIARSVEQRRSFWETFTAQVLEERLPIDAAKSKLEGENILLDRSPVDPANGRYKLDIHDGQVYRPLLRLKGPLSLHVQIVYDRSHKPIGSMVREVSAPD